MAILRSIAAVLAGMVFVIVASTGTDLALQKTVFPAMNTGAVTPALLALALAYRTAYGVIAGWLCAKIAPGRPMAHALALGAIGTAAAVAGVVIQWKLGANWYPIALAVLALPQSWLGARLAASGR
jgi:hypothetical protein